MQSRPDIKVKTFTKWCNKHLKSVGHQVIDIQTDVGDGLNLIELVQGLSKKDVLGNKRKPTSRDGKLENVALVLKFLEGEKINLSNIKKEDIVDGNIDVILNLLWGLIQHYSLRVENKINNSGLARLIERLSPERRLMEWIQSKIPSQQINNFTSDWHDGRALGALVNAVSRNLCSDWQMWNSCDNLQNAREAMDFAQTWLNITQLLTPEDLVNPDVDNLSMMTYLSQFGTCSNQLIPDPPSKPSLVTTGRRKLEITWTKPSSDQNHSRRGFVVEFRKTHTRKWITCKNVLTKPQFTLSDLNPYQMYEVRVLGIYEEGMGPASPVSEALSPRPELDVSNVGLILHEADDRLCKYLEPSAVLQALRYKQVLTNSDVADIQQSSRYSDQVSRMLKILKQKSMEGYYSLMEALQAHRTDLFQELLKIESKYIFGYQEEGEVDKVHQLQFPLNDKRLEPIVTVRRKSSGGRVARIHYYDSSDTCVSDQPVVRPRFGDLRTDDTLKDSDTEELHIKVDFQTSTARKPQENLESEMGLRVFLQIAKPQYLSNIVNNVFGALGGVLNWFETGSLHFYVKSSMESAQKIREAVQNGVIAEQLTQILLTDEMLIGDDLRGMSFKAAMDDSDVSVSGIPGPPGQPLIHHDKSSTEMNLSWHPPMSVGSCKGIRYILEYKEVNSSDWIRANEEPIQDTSFRVDRLLNWMAEYHFRVTGVATSGQGPASEISDRCRSKIGFWYPQGKFPKTDRLSMPMTPLGIALNQNGDLAIADYNTQRVQVYNDRFKHKLSLNTKSVCKQVEESRPWQVAVTSDGTYFITDKTSAVKAYRVDGTFSHHFPGVSTKGVTSEKSDSQLCGIAVDRKNQVLIGDWFNMYISKHAADGTHIESIGVNISPYHLGVTPQGSLIVGSLETVAILDKRGEPLYTLSASSFSSWEPRGITCNKDTVMVANYIDGSSNGGIYCFSLSGVYLGFVKVDRPWCAAVTENGRKLFVAAGDGIQVFIKKA